MEKLLYSRWCLESRAKHLLTVLNLVVSSSAILVVFDFFMFGEHAGFFIQHRLFILVFGLICLPLVKTAKHVPVAMHLAPAFVYNGIYGYFLWYCFTGYRSFEYVILNFFVMGLLIYATA